MKGHSTRMKTLGGLAVLMVALFACTAGVAAAAGTSPKGATHPVSAQQDQYSHKTVVPPAPPAGTTGSAAPAQSTGGSTLPFTGLSLLFVVLAGAGLIVLGMALRWRREPREKKSA